MSGIEHSPSPTWDSLTLAAAAAAARVVRRLGADGYRYGKCGVMLDDLVHPSEAARICSPSPNPAVMP